MPAAHAASMVGSSADVDAAWTMMASGFAAMMLLSELICASAEFSTVSTWRLTRPGQGWLGDRDLGDALHLLEPVVADQAVRQVDLVWPGGWSGTFLGKSAHAAHRQYRRDRQSQHPGDPFRHAAHLLVWQGDFAPFGVTVGGWHGRWRSLDATGRKCTHHTAQARARDAMHTLADGRHGRWAP